MTSARLSGCQRIRSNAQRDKHKFKGFVPTAEDWHTKMCMYEVKMLTVATIS